MVRLENQGLGQNLAWGPQPGLQIPELFSGPHSGTFFCTFFAAFPGNSSNNVDPADPTKFAAFPGNPTNNVDKNPDLAFLVSNFLEMRRKTCRKKFRNGAQKKVPESAGLAGRSRHRLGSPSHTLAQTRFPSRAQNIKNGPKWVQNRRFGLKIGPRESCGHFGPVRTGLGQKSQKVCLKNARKCVMRGRSI